MKRKTVNKGRIKSLTSLLLAFLPLFIFGHYHGSGSLVDDYKELFWAFSIPGFLYFIKYEILLPPTNTPG